MALLTVFRNANNKLMKMLRSLENYFISFPLRETILHNEKWMNEFISTVSLCWSSGNLERIDIWCWSSTSFCFQNTNSLFLWIPWIARGKKKSRAQSKYRNIIKTISCTFSSDKKIKGQNISIKLSIFICAHFIPDATSESENRVHVRG